MPLCGQCFKDLKCPTHGTSIASKAALECNKDCGVWVRVTDNFNMPVEDVRVTVEGQTRTTDEVGFAGFDQLPVKLHSAKITVPGQIAMKYEPLEDGTDIQSGQGAEGQILLFQFKLVVRAKLKVKVVQKDKPEKVLGGATVKLTVEGDPDEKTTGYRDGIADFGWRRAAQYSIDVTPKDTKLFAVPAPTPVTLTSGEERVVEIEVDPIYMLRLILLDEKDKPIAGRKWSVQQPANGGTTGDNGLIEVPLAPGDTEMVLDVNLHDERQPVQPAPGDPPAKYPPIVQGHEFEDTDTDPVLPPEAQNKWTWTLTVADPEKVDMGTDEWLKSRLHNLGFGVDTTAAVKAYQLRYEKNTAGSGALADIEADLKKRHDVP